MVFSRLDNYLVIGWSLSNPQEKLLPGLGGMTSAVTTTLKQARPNWAVKPDALRRPGAARLAAMSRRLGLR